MPYYKRDFWSKENLKYLQPHFRMEKCAYLLNRLARDRECDLLDVGCGPGTLMRLLSPNLHYYGIDIAIHEPAPNLLQADFLETPLAFYSKRFDIILAQGVFEYVGSFQAQKFREISRLLRAGGKFIVSYVNFDHRHIYLYSPYNNVQRFDRFKAGLADVFQIDRIVPTSHHWKHHEPTRPFMKMLQMHMNCRIPLISSWFAVEYLFICSLPRVGNGEVRTVTVR